MRAPAARALCPIFTLCLLLSAPLGSQDVSHTVVTGDTLYSISRSYGVSVDALRTANGMTPSSVLKAGQKLIIPGKASPSAQVSHTVQKGDTLYGLAKTYGVSVDSIRGANALAKDSSLKIGQILKIPGGKTATATAAVSATGPKPSPVTVKTTGSPSLSWPVEGKRNYLTGKLYGIGISGLSGSPVRSVSAGTVIQAGAFQGYGQVVFVERSDKLIYAYAGMGELSVRMGESVQGGAKLGELPAVPGESPVLSFLVFKGGRAMDPAAAPRD